MKWTCFFLYQIFFYSKQPHQILQLVLSYHTLYITFVSKFVVVCSFVKSFTKEEHSCSIYVVYLWMNSKLIPTMKYAESGESYVLIDNLMKIHLKFLHNQGVLLWWCPVYKHEQKPSLIECIIIKLIELNNNPDMMIQCENGF